MTFKCHSRSSKMSWFHRALCDFLLPFHSNYGPVSIVFYV